MLTLFLRFIDTHWIVQSKFLREVSYAEKCAPVSDWWLRWKLTQLDCLKISGRRWKNGGRCSRRSLVPSPQTHFSLTYPRFLSSSPFTPITQGIAITSGILNSTLFILLSFVTTLQFYLQPKQKLNTIRAWLRRDHSISLCWVFWRCNRINCGGKIRWLFCGKSVFPS